MQTSFVICMWPSRTKTFGTKVFGWLSMSLARGPLPSEALVRQFFVFRIISMGTVKRFWFSHLMLCFLHSLPTPNPPKKQGVCFLLLQIPGRSAGPGPRFLGSAALALLALRGGLGAEGRGQLRGSDGGKGCFFWVLGEYGKVKGRCWITFLCYMSY